MPVWRDSPAHSFPVFFLFVFSFFLLHTDQLRCSQCKDWSHNSDKCTHMQRTYWWRLHKSLRGKCLAGLDKPTFENTAFTAYIVSLCYFLKWKTKCCDEWAHSKKTVQSGSKLAQVVSTGHWFFNRNFSLKEKIIELETTCWCACPEVSVLTHVYPYTQSAGTLGVAFIQMCCCMQ